MTRLDDHDCDDGGAVLATVVDLDEIRLRRARDHRPPTTPSVGGDAA